METGNKGNLTPEQVAQLSKHKTTVSQGQQPNKTVKSPIHSTVKKVYEQTQQKQQSAIIDNDNGVYKAPVESNADVTKTDNETYFKYQDQDGGNMEIDLITFREKGMETRYLSLSVTGINIDNEPPTPQQALLTIGSKDSFDKLKLFFSQLNWED